MAHPGPAQAGVDAVPPAAAPRVVQLAGFLNQLADAVVLLDRHGRVAFANAAVQRLLPSEVGQPLAQWRGFIDEPSLRWLQQRLLPAARAARGGAAAPAPADGRFVLAVESIGAELFALRVQPRPATPAAEAAAAPATAPALAPQLPPPLSDSALTEQARAFWASPFPAFLQDSAFRLIDVNAAFAAFTGLPRARLLGTDPLALQPEADRADSASLRQRATDSGQLRPERRLVDADGRERWFREASTTFTDRRGQPLYLGVLQDVTAEHLARERAERSVRELDDWFDLSPVGMVLFDDAGLLVHSNPAATALVGQLPERLSQASAALRGLLACDEDGPLPQLQPGSAPVGVRGWLPQPPAGAPRLLSALVRCYLTSAGQRRYMAVVEDRSAEEERDLAQTQIGALMDTAGIGLATFQESSGWLRPARAGALGLAVDADADADAQQAPHDAPTAADAAARSTVRQSISRDIVLPQSLHEYERLQHALRHAQRAEVRYAIRHAALGERWLLTRVEPATLQSGKRTTSVVTLDVTEQHLTQQRNEQLLRELTTILDSTSAGIAYLRGNRLVRCNRRFALMLGLPREVPPGTSFEQLFARTAGAARLGDEALAALGDDQVYEAELALVLPSTDGTADDAPPAAEPRAAERPMAAADDDEDAAGSTRWVALSVRRSTPAEPAAAAGPDGPADPRIEAIVVLSDITRLKTQQTELEILVRDRELMFSLSEVGIAFVRDGVLQRANAALAQLADRPAAELAGLPLVALFPDAAPGGADSERERESLRDYGRWVGERQLRRRNGKSLWVQVSQRLVHAGNPAGGIIASYVNVDARHRAEKAVALQAERTRAILDSVLVGIVTVGTQGIEWMNRSARRMFGGNLADFVGQPIDTVAPPEAEHPFRRTRAFDELVEGQAETFECRVKARDGREFWVVGNAVMTGREQTGPQLTYALLDIERRRQAEARTADAQASLQRIIEAAPMAITLRDARTLRVVQVNEAAARSVSMTPQQMVGRAPEDIFPPPRAAERRRDMERALATASVTQVEYRYDAGGAARVWDARYLPLAGVGRAADQLLLIATDVSEQRAAQQAKFEAEIAQRDMLVKEVHHRIKNNLQGVAGLLRQIAVRKPEMASSIAEVVGQVQAIAQVYGLQVGAAGPLRAKNVVEAIAMSVQRTFGSTIAFTVEGAAPQRWAFPENESIPIALTLNELLTNAVKHGGGGGGGGDGGDGGDGGSDDVGCRLVCGDDGVAIVIDNRGRLPAGFSVSQVKGGVSGLGLVRALLPRRSATLTIEQLGDRVVTRVALVAPGVSRLPAD